jgi:branched-chain amino acid transport system permease protein
MIGMICGGTVGYVLDRMLFRGMRTVGVSLIAQMVITIGMSIAVRYVFLYYFGGSPRFFADYAGQRAMSIGPVEITSKDLVSMIISVVVLGVVGGLLQLTRIGKAMRAVADNRDLAESSGIDVQRVISVVWIAGGALAALGGVFFGLDQIKWDLGFRVLLLIFAAVVLGGLGTAYGALVGAVVVGLAINWSTMIIDAELKNMVALLVLVLILLLRPQGILGRAERVG